ncbi:hypothetical protein KBY24_14255 [Ruegeria pomeroyi]|nr:hypothetical protein [Ruegeria pomeroyi]
MGKFSQTFARIGAGLTMLGALIWLLWPSDFLSVLEPEPLFVFCVSFVVWVFTEFKLSEELGSHRISSNDIRNAREVLTWHSSKMRSLLKEADLWSFVPSDRYSDIRDVVSRWEKGQLFFHNKTLAKKFDALMRSLDQLYMKIAMDTAPEMIGGIFRTGYKPYGIVTDEEYERRRELSKEANAIASTAWTLLDELSSQIRRDMPEAVENPLPT